ncbi:MAG TPA: hypothetical protein VF818_10695 [Ktedonobacterales bacterium]
MRETSLRWGLGMGAIAATIGVIAQLVGSAFQPHSNRATFDQAIKYVLIAGPLVLIALGVALGLAYYAGLRAERDRPPKVSTSPDELPPWGGERRDSWLAGVIVMAAYWLITSLYTFVLTSRTPGFTLDGFLTQKLVQGLIFLAFGYGMGALGGRAPAAHSLLDSITIAAPSKSQMPAGTDPAGIDTPSRSAE